MGALNIFFLSPTNYWFSKNMLQFLTSVSFLLIMKSESIVDAVKRSKFKTPDS